MLIHRCYKAYTHRHNIVSQGARHTHTHRGYYIYTDYRHHNSEQWKVSDVWWPLRGGDGWGPRCKQGKVAGLLSRKLGVEGISGWSAKWQESESLEVKSLTHWVVCLNKCVRLALARTIGPGIKRLYPQQCWGVGDWSNNTPYLPCFTHICTHIHTVRGSPKTKTSSFNILISTIQTFNNLRFLSLASLSE